MQIRKIRFENIHSLMGEHEIDFAEGILAEAGLFAITGATGSGKSTLLDVITLALYDRTARMGKLSDSLVGDDGGIMTRNMKSCYAEVEYRVNGKDYRSHWSIERNRNNNLNQRKMEVADARTGEILENRIRETPEKNNEIIGLSYDQFIKAIVLAQGDFSKLLLAKRKERNELLGEITGALHYREIGKAVYFRYRGIGKSIELKEANLEGIELLSTEVIAEKTLEFKALTKAKPEIEKTYQIASDKINTRKDLQIREIEWKELEKEKLKLKEDFDVFHPYGKELEQHDRLSKYAVELREFDLAVKELDGLNEQLKQLQHSKSETETQQKSYLEAISKLVKEEVDIKTANHKLEAFRNKIVGLQAEEKKKQDEANLYQNQVNTYVRSVNQLGYELPKAEKPEPFKLEYDSFQKTIQKSIDNSGVKSMEELNAGIEVHRDMLEKSRDFLSKKELAVKFHKNIEIQKEKLKISEETFAIDAKKIESLTKAMPGLTKEVEDLEKNLEHQRKHQSLEQYRHQLESEQPCPLCGSLEHPYASEEPYFDLKVELLNEKKMSLKTKSELVVSLNAKSKFQTKQIVELQSEIKTTAEEDVQNQKFLIELAKELNWNHEATLVTLQARRIELTNTIQKMEKSKQAFQASSILVDLKESLIHWETASTNYVSLKEERKELYENNDINEKSNALSSKTSHSIASILSLEKQLHDNVEKLRSTTLFKTQKEENLSNIVLKEELESIEILRTAILSEERASKIRKQQSDLNERKIRISEKDTSLAKVLKELRGKDDAEITYETLTLLFEESKRKRDELLVNMGKISQSLEADEKAKVRQQKVLDEINLLKKDLALWKTMNDLIGDSSGSKFSNFVQDLTLEQLIGFTNKRLEEFSDRYLLDIPTADEAEKSDTLKVFDKYMGDARRSVRTLSGGETFLVSLAMAFALSDIAARNVKIESLFIDEGFGTLDPETLDQAITILEKMQNEGDKSVGVISHVGALKERITTQIQLDKNGLGYSTIKVVQ